MDQIIVALDMRDNDKVGCACYIAGEGRLLCMEEISGGGVDVVENRKPLALTGEYMQWCSQGVLTVKIDLQPTTLLLSTRSDSALNLTGGRLTQRHSSLVENGEYGSRTWITF